MTSDRHKRVCELFFRVVDLTPEEQATILSAECGEDLELRRAVEAMLASDLSRSILSDRSGRPAQFSAENWIGKTLGHYQIGEELGEGGMGIVFSARDVRLGRSVALKILPPERVTNPDQKRRFLQEARSASALNHPNIVQVFDIGQQDGVDFIVMERVSGKLLGDLILEDGVPLNQALHYSAQIADALETAHQVGIVHRDLKPSNAIVDERGNVKVLDFGLAKLIGDASRSSGPGTLVDDYMTKQGLVLGTVAYMSPEQAEGQQVDARSDIFSLGSMLYEMLSGQHPFRRETPTGTLAAVIAQEPEPLKDVNPHVSRVVQRCLRKDPERRFQTMADLKVALQELEEDVSARRLISVAPTPAAQPQRGRWWPFVAAAGVVALAIAAWIFRSDSSVPTEPYVIKPLTTDVGHEIDPAFSPDGSRVAYIVRRRPDSRDLHVRVVGAANSLQLTDTKQRESSPSWSPDGRRIAFLRSIGTNRRALMVVSSLGGAARILTEVEGAFATTTWSPDGKWLISSHRLEEKEGTGLYAFPVEAGEPRRLTKPPPGSHDFGASFSPDGQRLIFTRSSAAYLGELYTLSLAGGFADLPEPEVLRTAGSRCFFPAWSADGRDVLFSTGPGGPSRVFRVRTDGSSGPQRLFPGEHSASSPVVAYGHGMAAFVRWTDDESIYRVDIARKERRARTPRPFVVSTLANGQPSYSPDGRRIAFNSNRTGNWGIWLCDADGNNPSLLFDQDIGVRGSPVWSPDGRRIAFEDRASGATDVYVIGSDGGMPVNITDNDAANDSWPQWSHDGRWLYFPSSRSGRQEIWKTRVDEAGAVGDPVQVTKGGGEVAMESPDGRYLYYVEQSKVWRMPVSGGEGKEVISSVHRAAFAVTESGIYYVAPPNQDGRLYLQYHEFNGGRTETITDVQGPLSLGLVELSPDGESLLFCRGVQSSDLMLVENFQ